MAVALAAGAPGKRQEAMTKLLDDVVAPSGKRPRRSRWATWQRMHANWMGDAPVLPLTPHTIAAVIAQLKEGGYRSVGDYMSTAKGKHLEQYEWSSRLARAHTIYVRSALRGIGPAKQCEEVPLQDMVKGAELIADKPNTPVGLNNTIVILYFFVMREIELGTTMAASATTDPEKEVVRILLPATKTDPMALTCVRSWGCVCGGGDTDEALCPYHATRAQQELLAKTFGDQALEEGFPFSPDVHGDAVE